MQTKWVEKEFAYDGSQLKPRYNYLEHGVLGDSIVAWIGPCNIPCENIVDGEDLLEGSEIRGDKMLHFIVEKFDISLFAAASLQRLMGSLCKDLVKELAPESSIAQGLVRKGDDLYFADRKFNISIATQSTNSCLIHLGINCVTDGTPVPTLSFSDLQIDALKFGKELMSRVSIEVASITRATQKVRPL